MRDWLKYFYRINLSAAFIGAFLALILSYLSFFLSIGRWIGEHVRNLG